MLYSKYREFSSVSSGVSKRNTRGMTYDIRCAPHKKKIYSLGL